MSAISACPEHGYVEGAACPDCGVEGPKVLGTDRRTRLSKFLSGALRHFPADAGLALDERGFAVVEALVEAALTQYDWARPEHVAAVLATDPNGRFERAGDRVRAAYGHSVDVDLEPTDDAVPDRLYHGTAPANIAAIEREGLEPMGRQAVHLSATRAAARAVGRRHAATPAVFAVDAAAVREDGHSVSKRGAGTYTVDRVPPSYLTVVENGTE